MINKVLFFVFRPVSYHLIQNYSQTIAKAVNDRSQRHPYQNESIWGVILLLCYIKLHVQWDLDNSRKIIHVSKKNKLWINTTDAMYKQALWLFFQEIQSFTNSKKKSIFPEVKVSFDHQFFSKLAPLKLHHYQSRRKTTF